LDEFYFAKGKPLARCKTCTIEVNKQYATAHPGENAKATKRWREKNPEKMKEAVRRWDRANPEKKLAAAKLAQKRYPAKFVASVSRRRASKLRATPAWADEKAIRQYYVVAKYLSVELGYPSQVDHVVPLKSEMVCGLHTQANLSILPAVWNQNKGNRQWPDMP
jgi:5-methylcytosine-specific restriction endonuclease McrA